MIEAEERAEEAEDKVSTFFIKYEYKKTLKIKTQKLFSEKNILRIKKNCLKDEEGGYRWWIKTCY